MKICMIGYNIEPRRNEAINKQVFNISQCLTSKKNEIFIISISNKDITSYYDGIKIYSYKGIKSIYEIRKAIKKEKPDVIHDHFGMIGSSLITLLLTRGMHIKRFKTVYSTTFKLNKLRRLLSNFKFCDYLNEIIPRLILDNKFIRKKVFSFFDKIIFINKIQMLEEGSSKSFYIPPFISLPKESSTYKKEILKKQLGILKNDKVMLYLGHASRKKGIYKIAGCLNSFLNKKNIKFLFAFSGIGKEEKHFIVKYKKYNPIVTYPFKKNISDLYAISNVFILPLIFPWAATTTPLTILESLKLDTPVIITKNKFLDDIIFEKKNGYILENLNKSDNIIQAINFFIKKDKEHGMVLKYSKNKLNESTQDKLKTAYNNIYILDNLKNS